MRRQIHPMKVKKISLKSRISNGFYRILSHRLTVLTAIIQLTHIGITSGNSAPKATASRGVFSKRCS